MEFAVAASGAVAAGQPSAAASERVLVPGPGGASPDQSTSARARTSGGAGHPGWRMAGKGGGGPQRAAVDGGGASPAWSSTWGRRVETVWLRDPAEAASLFHRLVARGSGPREAQWRFTRMAHGVRCTSAGRPVPPEPLGALLKYLRRPWYLLASETHTDDSGFAVRFKNTVNQDVYASRSRSGSTPGFGLSRPRRP